MSLRAKCAQSVIFPLFCSRCKTHVKLHLSGLLSRPWTALPDTDPDVKGMKCFNSTINFLFLMVALNWPTSPICFSFQVEKIPELHQVTTPNIVKPRNYYCCIFFPYSVWKRVINMTCNTAYTEVFNLGVLWVSLMISHNCDSSLQASLSSCFMLQHPVEQVGENICISKFLSH